MNHQELQHLDDLRHALRKLEMCYAIANELLAGICQKADEVYYQGYAQFGKPPRRIPYSMTLLVPDSGYAHGGGDAFAMTEV